MNTTEKTNLNYLTGVIVTLEPIVTGKSWTKQNFLIRDVKNENRLYYLLTFKEEVIHLLTRMQPGDTIQVYFNCQSNPGSSGRYFTDLLAWKIYPVKLTQSINEPETI